MRLITAFILLFLITSQAFSQEECEALLKGGVFERFENNRRSLLIDNYKEWLTTATKEEVTKATNAGLDVSFIEPNTLIPINLGADFSSDQWRKFEEAKNQGFIKEYTSLEVTNMLRIKGDSRIIDAYLECVDKFIQDRAIGLKAKFSKTDSFATVELTWIPDVVNPHSTITISDEQLVNINGTPMLRGRILEPRKKLVHSYLIADKTKQSLIQIHTDAGTAYKIFEGERAPIVAPTPSPIPLQWEKVEVPYWQGDKNYENNPDGNPCDRCGFADSHSLKIITPEISGSNSLPKLLKLEIKLQEGKDIGFGYLRFTPQGGQNWTGRDRDKVASNMSKIMSLVAPIPNAALTNNGNSLQIIKVPANGDIYEVQFSRYENRANAQGTALKCEPLYLEYRWLGN
jgi:hypothetical protein